MKPWMRALVMVGWSLPLALSGCAWIKPQPTGTAPNAPSPAEALPPAQPSAAAPPAAPPAAPSAASPEQTASASAATADAGSGATSAKANKRADAGAAVPRAQSAPAAPAAPAARAAPAIARKPPPAAPAAEPPAPSTAVAVQTLNLADLEQRLKDTRAIGVFTKLSLKNQVDDLLAAFRDVYRGPDKHPPAELRQRYDQLLLKVLDLLRNGDPPLAQAIASSREAIWSILADPGKFEKI